MIEKINKWLPAVAVLLLVYLVLVGGSNQSVLGASGTRFPNGVSADVTSPVAGELRGDDLSLDDDAVITDDLTVNGSSFTLTTSNSATSTAIVGCIQMYATSTATAVRLTFAPSGNSTTTSQGAVSAGLVAYQFGSCPI
jgi:hypothetical protein